MAAPLRTAVAMAGATVTVPAFAAGGAHVIDDAAVETPGTCHLENWVSSAGGGSLFNMSPACTSQYLPTLELGGFATRVRANATTETTIGIAPKLLLQPEERGIGVALSGALGYSLDDGKVTAAAILLPLTIPSGDRLRVNMNVGWQWFRLGDIRAAFAGAQLEYAIHPGLGLMVEGFGRHREKAGGQAGLRWTSRGGRGGVDIDLLAARYVDGITPTTLTIGLTLRR